MSDWWKPSKPGAVKAQPWMSPEVTAYLGKLLMREWRVLEHGTGGSTLWLAERVKQVCSVEHDPDWLKAVKALAPENVTLLLWDERRLPDFKTAPFDLALIDGEPLEDRALYLDAAARLVRRGGWLVLDNYNRPEYFEARFRLEKKYEHVEFHARVGKYLNTEFFKIT